MRNRTFGQEFCFPTFPSSLLLHFSKGDCQKANAFKGVHNFPIYLCVCSLQHILLAAETIFSFDLKALICFITVCLNHLKKREAFVKNVKITVESKIQQSAWWSDNLICHPLQQARASDFGVIIFNLFYPWYHKNDALKSLSFKAIHL